MGDAFEEIWQGAPLKAAEIARFAPSACNTQLWYVMHTDTTLEVYRYKKPGKHGIMPPQAVAYYNRIDIGIYLSILEICLAEEGLSATRELFVDDRDEEYVQVARYLLNEKDEITGKLKGKIMDNYKTPDYVRRAKNNYARKFDRISLMLDKGTKERIRKKYGEDININGYIKDLINNDLNNNSSL